jgi:ribokinase
MTDLVTRADRMPVWGETLRGNSFAMGPGGKGSNQAVAAARLGGRVNLISRLGQDQFGRIAQQLYADEGLDTRFVTEDPEHPTATASITVDDASGENAIVTVPGACDAVTVADVDRAEAAIAEAAVFVSQLELPETVCRYALGVARRAGAAVLLNPAPALALPDASLAEVDYLTPNESEAAALVGHPVENETHARDAARALRDRGVTNVLITLGADGVYVSSPDYEGHIAAVDAGPVIETTGAGDAFNGALAAAIGEGRPLAEAVRFANAAAGLSVTQPGAAHAMPTRDAVERLMG